jgi:hypothetical protein
MASSSGEYRLVNPFVSGIKQTTRAADVTAGALRLWKRVGRYISSPLERMHITVEQTGTGKLHHFEVSEQENGDRIDYHVKPHTVKLSDADLQRFRSQLSDAEHKSKRLDTQDGGKKHKKHKKHDDDEDDSSSSSSDEDVYKRDRVRVKYESVYQPISYWWYAPYYGVETIWSPTFVSPLTFPIEIPLSWVRF